jgi:hypothetical protein
MEVVPVIPTHLPAWCERHQESKPDGRYTVACYYTRDGHPVTKARAERIELTEYAPDGTALRVEEGIVVDGRSEPQDDVVFTSAAFQFASQVRH